MKIGSSGKRLSALLPSCRAGGAIAAVHQLEAVGIDVGAAWSRWVSHSKQNSKCAIDFAAGSGDPMPGLVHPLLEIYLSVKTFQQRFLRSRLRASWVQASAKTKKLL